MNSGDYEPSEELSSDQVRRKAREMLELQPEITGEEYDFGELFARILWQKDWTDKLGSFLRKIRDRLRLRSTDTKLSEELRALIPDMKEVAKAYDEMTSGYKAFIQAVLIAKHQQ